MPLTRSRLINGAYADSKEPMSNYDPAFAQSIGRLKQLSPRAISAACQCSFDEPQGYFSVASLGREIHIAYPNGRVTFANTTEPLPFDWALVLLNHLSTAKPLPILGEWVSFGALPDGRFFAANIRRTALEPLGRLFLTCDQPRLLQALARLGFAPVEMNADLAAVGTCAPRVPVAVQFWNGEEELPPSCQILFDRTVTDQMHIEDIAALCGVVRRELSNAYAEVR